MMCSGGCKEALPLERGLSIMEGLQRTDSFCPFFVLLDYMLCPHVLASRSQESGSAVFWQQAGLGSVG
jgi:hypothetical protein